MPRHRMAAPRARVRMMKANVTPCPSRSAVPPAGGWAFGRVFGPVYTVALALFLSGVSPLAGAPATGAVATGNPGTAISEDATNTDDISESLDRQRQAPT